MKLRSLLLALLLPLLAGCVIEPAGFPIEGGNHSLTLERKKPYFWSSGWELSLVVTRYPECQRRHPLRKAGDARFRADLYSPQKGVYIVNQGSRWYVAETLSCQMQEFEEEPPQPGDYVGSFREKGGTFRFVPNADDTKSRE